MPASKLPMLGLVTVLVMSSIMFHGTLGSRADDAVYRLQPSGSVSASVLDRALDWLVANQPSNGSYGNYHEHWTAAAAYALWLNDSSSVNAAHSYSYLAAQMNNSATWFWGTFGEADVAGAVLYSIAQSSNLSHINGTLVSYQLLELQNATTGGFEGYSYCARDCDTTSPVYLTVTSSVDTDMALLGLGPPANLILSDREALAFQYLLSLQGPDGSFNLTSTRNFDPFYSQGPDTASITALTLLALKLDQNLNDAPRIARGLEYLNKENLANLCGVGHVYSAALSALAFKHYHLSYDAVGAMTYLVSHQNNDGGFSDVSRLGTYPQSNALDTGWAAIALEPQFSIQGVNYVTPNCAPVAEFTVDTRTPTAGGAVQFNASDSYDLDTDQLSYSWTFGDGSAASGVSPSHTYLQGGNFTVTLTVTDSGTDPGPFSDATSQTINVQSTTIQKSPNLLLSRDRLLLLSGLVGTVLIALIGAAFYLGRRSVRVSRLPPSK